MSSVLLRAPRPPSAGLRCVPGHAGIGIRARGELKVCIWPDYYGVTFRHPRTQSLVGIDIVDVRLKRVDYVDEINASVYERMKAERVKAANELPPERPTGPLEKVPS